LTGCVGARPVEIEAAAFLPPSIRNDSGCSSRFGQSSSTGVASATSNDAQVRSPGIDGAPQAQAPHPDAIGPVAIAIVRAVRPYSTTDSNATMAARVTANQVAEGAVVWLTFVVLLTLIPGVIALGMLARRQSPRLGTAGLVLTFAGIMCLFWSTVAGADNVALGAAHTGLSPSLTGSLLDSMDAIPPSDWRQSCSYSVTSSAWCCLAQLSGVTTSSWPGPRCSL
jgi:hypothetical protein